jgi:hypothetical protein
MADFTDRIKLIVDVTADKASKGLGDVKSSMAEAEGGFGKLKAGAGAAFDSIGIGGPQAAVAAAGAIVAFGKASIGAFTELALAAQNFSQIAGTSLEDSSRWIEVGGDLGVSTDAVAAAMQRLNREAAHGDLKSLGVDTGDVNERLIQTIERINQIPDASDRAAAQFKVFGKSSAAIAPLMANVETLRDRLADVEKAKIIDEEKAQAARDFTDAMDNLNDKLDDIKNLVGGELVGAFNDLFTSLNQVTDAIPGFDGLNDAIAKVVEIGTSPLRNVTDGLSTLSDGSESLADRARGLGQAIAGAIPGPFGSWAGNLLDVEDKQTSMAAATKAASDAAEEQAKAAKDAADALSGLLTATLAQFNGQLALQDSADKATESIGKYTTATATAEASSWGNSDANAAAAKAMNDAEGAALKEAAAAAALGKSNAELAGETWGAEDSARAQIGVLEQLAGTLGPNDPLRKHLLDYAAELGRIPAAKETQITADTTDAEKKVTGLLGTIRSLVLAPWTVKVQGQVTAPSSASAAPGSASTGVGASRGLLGASAGIPAATAAPVYNVINVSVTAAPLTHPAEVGRQIANYLDAFYRRNGTRLRAVP